MTVRKSIKEERQRDSELCLQVHHSAPTSSPNHPTGAEAGTNSAVAIGGDGGGWNSTLTDDNKLPVGDGDKLRKRGRRRRRHHNQSTSGQELDE